MSKKIQVKQILELRAAGLSQNNIAKSRHMSKSSVNYSEPHCQDTFIKRIS